MLNGITVLKEETVGSRTLLMALSLLALGICAALAVAVIIAIHEFFWSGSATDARDAAIFGGLSILISFVLVTAVVVAICPHNYKTKVYKVTVSDNVSLKEFNEQYEIIDQDDNVFTITEHKTKK